MTDLAQILPSDLSASGHWVFRASYRVHDGWGSMDGEGETIAEAIEAAFDENCDGSLDEAWEGDAWVVDRLSYEGHQILKLARKSHAEAETALLAFADFGSAGAGDELIRRYQTAHAAKRKVDGLVAELVKLLVKRNNR